jgi:PAS domain-containing protein
VAHVELSLTEPPVPPAGDSRPAEPLERWGLTVSAAPEPCLVIDAMSEIVAVSVGACALLGFPDQAAVVGRHLFAGILPLVDFTSAATPLTDGELEKIPPVLAYSSHRLARGLLRVRDADGLRTIDAVASPLYDGTAVVGSITFFCQI